MPFNIRMKDKKRNPWQLRVLAWAISVALFVFAANYEDFVKYYKIEKLTETGIHAEGIVDHVQWQIEGYKNIHHTRYYPVIDYKDKSGATSRFQDYLDTRYGNPSQKGSKVNILYDENDTHNAMIDNDKIFIAIMHNKIFLYIGLIIANICVAIITGIAYYRSPEQTAEKPHNS